MPSLEELANLNMLDYFATNVASEVERLRAKSVDVNEGITTTEQLDNLIAHGFDQPFDYDRLIAEAKTYA